MDQLNYYIDNYYINIQLFLESTVILLFIHYEITYKQLMLAI